MVCVLPLAPLPARVRSTFGRTQFTVEEIYDFAQEDLIAEDIMLLDTYDEVFVWIGSGANATEKKLAVETAAAYVTNAPDHRKGEDTPIVVVKQGFEPKIFTAHFPGWNAEKAKVRGMSGVGRTELAWAARTETAGWWGREVALPQNGGKNVN